MNNKPLKTGKYTCNVLNCGGGECVHDYIRRRCPHCGYQLVKVARNGWIFCSHHESICDYEESPTKAPPARPYQFGDF